MIFRKTTIFITAPFLLLSLFARAQGSVFFTDSSSGTKCWFYNQSNISNVHYFWNFGDGRGSCFSNPVHNFPGPGLFLVTLFATDTINGGSDYHETYVRISDTTATCHPYITDSIFNYMGDDVMLVIDSSTVCNYPYVRIDGGPALNFPPGWMIYLGGYWQTTAFRMVTRKKFCNSNLVLQKEAYHSATHNYSSSHNYQSCSANFEFNTIFSDSTGERILFRAMNDSAVSYHWMISGFGPVITSGNDTISQYFPYVVELWDVGLDIIGPSGCHDTIWQNILVRPHLKTLMSQMEFSISDNVILYPNPSDQSMSLAFPSIQMEPVNVTIMDITGKICYRESIGALTNEYIISTAELADGIYFLRCVSNGSESVAKFTVLHGH